MRVRVKTDGDESEKIGTICELHPVLTIKNPMKGMASHVFNYVSVKYDPPLEMTQFGPLKGGTMDPKELEPLDERIVH